MGKRKQMTDEQLKEMGLLASQMHKQAIAMWVLACDTMPFGSEQYRKISRAGRAIQDTMFALERLAEKRNWPDEELKATFSKSICSFY